MTRPTGVPASDPESGRILLLTLGFAVVALMLVAMVVSATAVHLDRKRLFNLADVAAAEAAQWLDAEYFGSTSPPEHLALSATGIENAAAAAVERNLELTSESRITQVRILEAATSDGVTAEVTLTAVTNPPLLGWFTDAFLDGIDLSATSRARSPLQAG
ncbi:pilus assembly protein TadG-related protein [Xylanimonas cellulosilytica]|uniref:pilus assembly protein TadG-related protein n=1 Tax=Xylanimonas cellulosilytica TaxID=186189 RepID=UPI0005A01131|nr:pilus assembly protein TadG-related protein [Xylanimonas cellulosilytica]